MQSENRPDLRSLVSASLRDRVVIITGAGQGIGRVFAKAFALAGAIPIIAERNHQRGQSVAEEIAADGGRAVAIRTDVSDPQSAAISSATDCPR